MATLWRFLNRPRVWGALYLAAIPLFAVVFQSLPRSFYHATSGFEPEVQRLRYVLADSLSAKLRRGFVERYPTGLLRTGEWMIHGSTINVPSVYRFTDDAAPLYARSPEEPYARFVLRVSAVDTTGMVMATCTADLLLDVSRPRLPADLDEVPVVRLLSAAPPSVGIRTTASPILEARGAEIARRVMGSSALSTSVVLAVLNASPWGTQTIALPSDLVNAMKEYCDALNGFPGGVEGNYWRMLYVSAVTITTLGFGDVLPVTRAARAATAAEAVLGIVLIGLFLNSVAGAQRERAKGEPMPTREQVEAIHRSLDAGSRVLGDVLDALTVSDGERAKALVLDATKHLGECKEALRVVHVGPPAPVPGPAEAMPTTTGRPDLIRYAADVRSQAQAHMVAVAAGALALTVTFRDVFAKGAANATWALRWSWVAFTACVVALIAERFITSVRMTIHGVQGTAPTTQERWMLAAPHLASLVSFAAGVLLLAIFGWRNL